MEFIIIALLICYIVFLHYHLYKKNQFIESIVGKLTKMEQQWGDEHVMQLLQKLQYINAEPVVKKDKLFDQKILDYLFEGEKDLRLFVHYTKEEEVARKIFVEGFRFIESFDKTAEPIVNDLVDLTYKHNVKKYYGKYIIVLGIANSIYSKYDNELKQLRIANIQVEQILTEIHPCINENQDNVYILAHQFIKGYVNYETGEITPNPAYNPSYDSLIFKANLEKLKIS